MFEKLIALFERFVVAQEKMVALMSAQPCVGQAHADYPEVEDTPFSDPKLNDPPESPAPVDNPQEATKKTDLWNPYDHEPQMKYMADKRAIMDTELEILGIDGTGMTGRQKHEAILNHNADTALEPPVDTVCNHCGHTFAVPESETAPVCPKCGGDAHGQPADENPFAEEPATEITHEELITELRSYMETFPDITEGKKAVSDLLKNSVGVPNVSAVPEDKRGIVLAAIPRTA